MHQFNDEHRRFVSSRYFWGMPAPVWTMVLWGFVEFVNLGIALAFVSSSAVSVDTVALGVGCLYMLGLILLLLIMRDSTPVWFLHSQVIAIIVLTCLLVFTSTNHLDMVNSSFALFGVTMYSSYWFKRKTALIYIVSGALGYFVAILLSGEMQNLFLSWFTISTVCIAVGMTFSTVVMHLYSQAVTDSLTGLLNRSGLQMLIDLQSLSGRAEPSRVLIVIDLDDFKKINDEEGHLAGDAMLQKVGNSWKEMKRADDIVIRTGGDEFLFILPSTTVQEAETFVARLKKNSPCEWSYGIAEWASSDTFDTAVKQADIRLYEDKARRRLFKDFVDAH